MIGVSVILGRDVPPLDRVEMEALEAAAWDFPIEDVVIDIDGVRQPKTHVEVGDKNHSPSVGILTVVNKTRATWPEGAEMTASWPDSVAHLGRSAMMTEVDPGRRPLPQTTLQFAGHAAENVVSGLSGRSPYMLGIVLLNMLGIAAAIYFLNILIQGQQRHLAALLQQQSTQQTEILNMHQREFDALLALLPRAENIPPIMPTPATPAAPPRGSAR